MLRPLALLVLAGLVAASALGAGLGTTALWPDGGGHNHADGAQHATAGFGMQLVSYLNLGTTIGELDVKQDATGKTWVLVALTAGGFALVDGTDPATPILAGKYSGANSYAADAKLSDDSNTVYLGLNGGGAQCDLSTLPVVPTIPKRDTCGIQVWDATVKTNAQFVGTLPTNGGGTHMLDYEVMNGIPIVASISGYGGAPPGMVAIAPGNKLPIGVGALPTQYMHDVTLTMDPQQPGRALALTADGYQSGMSVWDITNPTLPTLLGSWHDPQNRYLHTVHMSVIEGKRVIAAAEECWYQAASAVPCTLWFLDATDFGAMTVLGKWQNPDAKPSTSWIRFSTHDFEFKDGKLYMGHYHGGVVVLDVSTLAKVANPPLLANYLPNKARVTTGICGDVPCVWDAVPDRGVVWLSDINSGLYAARLA